MAAHAPAPKPAAFAPFVPAVPPVVCEAVLRALRRVARDGGVTLFIALTYYNISTFGFHVVVSRILGPGPYGALGAVLAVTSLAGNATGAASTAVTRTVAVIRAGGGDPRPFDLRRTQRRGLATAAAATAIIAALAPVIERYLHLGSATPVLFLALMAGAILAGLVPRGVLMGERRFEEVAACLAIGVTVKLILGAALAVWAGVSGAVGAAAIGEALMTARYYYVIRQQHGTVMPGRELRVPARSFSLATGAYAGFWFLAATDTFLARHLLAADPSGLYVAASTAGSIALFLPNNITLTAFPALAGAAGGSAADRSGRDRSPAGVPTSPAGAPTIAATSPAGAPTPSPPGTFAKALAAAAALTIVSSSVLALVPGLVIAVLFGPGFRDAAPILTLLAISNGAQGMVSFLLHHQLAHHRATCLLPWVALVALAIVANAAHHSAVQIATEAMTVSLVLCVAMAALSAHLALAARAPEPEPEDVLPLPAGFVKD
jgi:O-antigen/teichoic acid export membrane protein